MIPQTIEELFQALIAQGAPSTDEQGHCQYRGDKGRKCAAGWMIADEHYRPEFEGRTTNDLPIQEALRLSGCQIEMPLMSRAQSAHDQAERLFNRGVPWKDALIEKWTDYFGEIPSSLSNASID